MLWYNCVLCTQNYNSIIIVFYMIIYVCYVVLCCVELWCNWVWFKIPTEQLSRGKDDNLIESDWMGKIPEKYVIWNIIIET